uniref:protein-serine/threonine phosphatase n=1 Tax=Aegilops tauschii subsp. strangulata TaxID=200361 RepID=A0A453F2A3_AEGTS
RGSISSKKQKADREFTPGLPFPSVQLAPRRLQLTHARHPPPEKRDFGALEAIEMVPDGSVKDQEASSSSSPPAAAIARAARPPRPVSFKTKRIVWHPLKHRRFRVGATKTMVEASSSAQAVRGARDQAVRGAREVGEATTAAAAMGSPKEDEKGHICGGWKSEDGSLYCGYSSLRGRRASMEDFYDMRSSKMGAKNINLFGVFDGEKFTVQTLHCVPFIVQTKVILSSQDMVVHVPLSISRSTYLKIS